MTEKQDWGKAFREAFENCGDQAMMNCLERFFHDKKKSEDPFRVSRIHESASKKFNGITGQKFTPEEALFGIKMILVRVRSE
jgi:hypothetical protein